MKLLLAFVLTGLLVLMLTGVSDARTMRLGLQDDTSMMYATPGYLARADKAHARVIRLMVPDNHWTGESTAYVNAACAAKASGRTVIGTLLAWQSKPTAARWEAYARDVVGRMAGCVDVWSPMNEPNHPSFAPAGGSCSWSGCSYGRVYGQVWDRVAPVIRQLDPTALLCVGDVAPSRAQTFMDQFFSVAHAVRPDVLCVHPYGSGTGASWGLANVEGAAAYAAGHGLPLWVTEWAYLASQNMPATAWVRALSRMEAAGAQVAVVYDTAGGSWDSRMPDAALDAVSVWAAG